MRNHVEDEHPESERRQVELVALVRLVHVEHLMEAQEDPAIYILLLDLCPKICSKALPILPLILKIRGKIRGKIREHKKGKIGDFLIFPLILLHSRALIFL